MRSNEFSELPQVVTVLIEEPKLRGMRICITGHLGASRSEVEEVIRKLGGCVEKNVTQSTTHLLTNQDWNDKAKSNKFIKAKSYGVKLITEKEFYEIVNADPNS